MLDYPAIDDGMTREEFVRVAVGMSVLYQWPLKWFGWDFEKYPELLDEEHVRKVAAELEMETTARGGEDE